MRSKVRPNISRVMAEEVDRPVTASHDNVDLVTRMHLSWWPCCECKPLLNLYKGHVVDSHLTI